MTNGMLLYAHVEAGRPPRLFTPDWGARAYERYQIPFYLDELRRIHETDYTCWTPGVPYLPLAIDVLSERCGEVRFEEVGSTLFSTIDKLAKLHRAFALPSDITAVEFVGVEVMPTMVWLAERLHARYRVRHAATAPDDESPARAVVARCYQSSSYAFRSSEAFARWASRAAFGLQGVFFSRGQGDQTVSLLGNPVTLFDRTAFYRAMRGRGCHLVPLHASPLEYDDALACDEVFFITHRLTREEWARLVRACEARGVAAPPGVTADSPEALGAAPPLPGRDSRFITVRPRTHAAAASSAFGPALNFDDARIERAFIESLAARVPPASGAGVG